MTSTLAGPASKTTLTRAAWSVLAITVVFWIADGYDTFVLLLTAKPSLVELLPKSELSAIPQYIGYLVAATLLGWAIGGIGGGILGDKLGRRRTMLIGVAVYSIATVLAALTNQWWLLALSRLFTGIGIGAEWGVGMSLLQEVWPEKWRTRGAGLLQAGFSVGGLAASALWVLFGSTLDISWRWMYVVGFIPIIIVLVVYKRIPESKKWAVARTKEPRQSLFSPGIRRRFIAALFVSIAITGGWWAVTSFLPTFVGGLSGDPSKAAFYAGWSTALYNVGEIIGCVLLGFLSEWWGRKITVILYFAGSLLIVPAVFLGLNSADAVTWLQLAVGFFTGGLYSWYAVHTPELFPTRIRATAISTVFSASRIVALVGAVISGQLVSALGGFGPAASIFALIYIVGIVAVLFLPETRGKGLPA